METVFTPTTTSSFQIDALGKPMASSQAIPVTCRDLGDSIGADFARGDGILVIVRGPNTIVIDVPGVGTRQLVRMAQ